MKRTLLPTIGLLLTGQLAFSEITPNSTPPQAKWMLWYEQPAKNWNEALPLGNGHLGAMVFGTIPNERIQFNEYTVWTGHPRSYAHPGAVEHLPEIRRLLFDGKQKQAEDLAEKEFMSIPLGQMAYQPCGDLWIDFQGLDPVSNYRRWLDLDTATQTTEYEAGGVKFRREVVISHPDRALFLRISADKPGKINGRVRLTSPHKNSTTTATGNDRLVLRGQVQADGIRFESIAKVEAAGGSVSTTGDQLEVTNADQVLIRLVAATNFTNFRDITGDPAARSAKLLENASAKPWDKVLAGHLADHQSLFRRMDIDLGSTAGVAPPHQRAHHRLSARKRPPARRAAPSNTAAICSSAPAAPAASPPTCRASGTTRCKPAVGQQIHLQHQHADELLARRTRQSGRVPRAAVRRARRADASPAARRRKEHYGARGWVLHHNFDLWRGTAPINASNHGIWPTGGAWLCHHLWEHYLFTGDQEFLREKAYPIMKEAAEFFADYLIEDPVTKTLISGPSNSPEQGGLVMGPTMDHQIIRSLVRNHRRGRTASSRPTRTSPPNSPG